MTLEEILQIEAQNVDCIFLYQEEGAWYAYEHSAFYCYSLLGILDIDWLPGRNYFRTKNNQGACFRTG